VCVFSTRRTSEEHKAAGISELRPPNGDAEKRLMDIECRWNVYDVVLCKRIGLTDYDGNPDWGQFEKFLETLKRRPFAEKELNAERMGTQVRKAAGIPTALVPHVWRCGQNSDPFDQTQLTGAVFPAVLSEATPYATVTMEMQRLFAGDCNRRPAAIAAAINDDIYGAGWQDWVPFGVWLCEEYPLLLRSARVQGRRDQCRLAAEVVREAVVWGVIKDPLSDGSDALTFVNAPPLLISTQPQSSDEEEMGSSDDEVSDAEDEAPFLFGGVTPLTADRTPYKDMRCPDCGSTNAVARDFQCHVRAKGVTGRAGNSLV